MSRCVCGKPKNPHARVCVVCRAGHRLRPGVRQMTPAMRAALRRALRERAA